MLTVVKGYDDEILGCCEWRIVDQEGHPAIDGKYIWISELEVSRRYRHKNIIKKIILDIEKKAKETEYVYFQRRKYEKRIRLYKREEFVDFARRRKCLV